MKKNKISNFDLSFYFDNNLTEVPNDLKSFYKGILQLEKDASDENNKLKKCRLFSKIGSLYRIYGDNLKSEEYLLNALKLIDKTKNNAEYLIANIRLAHTYQKQKRFDLSVKLFSDSELMCIENENLKVYLDFVYQHTGKLKFDLKKYNEALIYFEKAMKLRELKGDEELISSTEFAIRITKDKLYQIVN